MKSLDKTMTTPNHCDSKQVAEILTCTFSYLKPDGRKAFEKICQLADDKEASSKEALRRSAKWTAKCGAIPNHGGSMYFAKTLEGISSRVKPAKPKAFGTMCQLADQDGGVSATGLRCWTTRDDRVCQCAMSPLSLAATQPFQPVCQPIGKSGGQLSYIPRSVNYMDQCLPCNTSNTIADSLSRAVSLENIALPQSQCFVQEVTGHAKG